ncbi:MAG: alkaline phosphatase family protein [Thermoleophilaceae bacterium]
MSRGGAKKLVLAVIDSLKPEMLERAIAEGRAPALQAIVERGVYVPDCVSVFPSVTPVASATITTGTTPDIHHIPAMNWFHRGERRYVEYGSSFPATRAFGVTRSLYDTVYNMNLAHLSRGCTTVFEDLEDAGVRSACTTYLIYRGRHRHPPASGSVLSRVGQAMQFRHAVYGPTELFYADLFESRPTGCSSTLGLPGQRDQHSGCVAAYMVENDLFDFLLLSLPDNDTYSHKRGPYAQVTSIGQADRAIERMMHVAGGIDTFLDEYAVIVMSDHSQTAVEDRINLAQLLADWRVLMPDGDADGADVAACPSARSASVYILDPSMRERELPRLAYMLAVADGVDFVAWHTGGEAIVRPGAAYAKEGIGELRFSPGGDLRDARGGAWSVEGDERVLELDTSGGRVESATYPNPLERLWGALVCPTSGDLLVSATPGYEFVDWGGFDHVGGGSHGSLHRGDSLGTLIFCGTGPDSHDGREQWTIADVAPLIARHFALP